MANQSAITEVLQAKGLVNAARAALEAYDNADAEVPVEKMDIDWLLLAIGEKLQAASAALDPAAAGA